MNEENTNTHQSNLPPKTIAKALVEAQRKIRGVEKSSDNQHHGYKYASAESIIMAARKALNDSGLAVSLAELRANQSHVAARYLVVHEGGDAWLTAPVMCAVCPGKGRPADKAEAASQTHALSYFLRDLLLIPRVDDADDLDTRDDRDHVPVSEHPLMRRLFEIGRRAQAGDIDAAGVHERLWTLLEEEDAGGPQLRRPITETIRKIAQLFASNAQERDQLVAMWTSRAPEGE